MEIAKFKYCPLCGSTDFTVDDRRLCCSSCDTTMYQNTCATGTVVLVRDDGRIGMSKRKFDPGKGTYDFPGGFLERMESPEDGCVREIQEELGITLDRERLVYSASPPGKYLYDGLTYDVIDISFTYPLSDELADKIVPNDDCEEMLFIRPEEVTREMCSAPQVYEYVQQFIKKRL